MPARTINLPSHPTLLGELTPAQFLKKYWQKKPLLIRQALPDFRPVLSKQALFDLAADDEVESRLVQQTRAPRTAGTTIWQLEHGPFSSCPRAKKNWTLLVQGVNLHDAAADALLRYFNFISYDRLDDLMVSYAVDGGGVGPHFDNYDVFLLQAQGQRRWRISAQTNLDLLGDAPLKILKNFRADEEFVLEPGDMLYLPPHVAHEGVAIGECMTYSIGFRAPTHEEIVREFLYDQADRLTLNGRYGDPGSKPARHPAKLDAHLIEQLFEPVARLRWSQADMCDFIGRYFTEPKAQVFFRPRRALSLARFQRRIQQSGLILHPKTQMLYRGRQVFINGTRIETKMLAYAWLRKFANQRSASATDCDGLNKEAATLALLHEWYEAGWLEIG